MLVLLIIICVLIGLAYADYCLVDNTAHFGITFQRIADEEESFTARLAHAVSIEKAVDETPAAKRAGGDFTVVPPAVDVPEIAAKRPEAPGRSLPLRRPGSERRNSGTFHARPSPEAGVAAIGN
jgi:hypothetical protein